MVVVGWAFIGCVVQLGGLHGETNIRHMFSPQLNTMAAALTMLLFLLHIFTASAQEYASEQGMCVNMYEKFRILKHFLAFQDMIA